MALCCIPLVKPAKCQLFGKISPDHVLSSLLRLEALKSRSSRRTNRGSAVVQIPDASIRMDLHTLYVANVSGVKNMKGKAY